MAGNLNRREFIKVLGVGATGVGVLDASPAQGAVGSGQAEYRSALRSIGKALRVKPALVYQLHERRQATSWRSWGGLHNQGDVDAESRRIGQELKDLASKAEFPIEVLPVSQVRNAEQAKAAAQSDCDVILIYAAGAWLTELDALAGSKKAGIMFLRHKSGPVYLWYEIAHPHFLRRGTDEYKQPDMNVWDIVVDDYGEILWRLRALYGLKNAVGTKIVAIGDAGGWGIGYELGPKAAKEIWKLDIKPVAYTELEPLIKKCMNDTKAVEDAQKQADKYLGQPGVSLHTDKKFLVNAFLLTRVFRELMERESASAITVHHCMGTIMPMSQTTACMPLSLLNDDGLMAFCESDFVVIPSGILLRHISGKPVFLNDPTHPHDGMVTIAHCTAPRRMDGVRYEPVEIHTHFESDYGAAPKVQMKKGELTTNIAPDFRCKKWVGFRGRIIDHPFYDICRSQVDITIEGDWRRLLKDMQGFHWMTCYGDYLREVGYALGKLSIEWENISEPAQT